MKKAVTYSGYDTTQVMLKRFYRFCKFRQYLLSVSKSGFYSPNQVRLYSKATKTNYNSIRADLSWMLDYGLIEKAKKHLALKKLSRQRQKLYDLYIQYENEIKQQKKPAIYFSDLHKRTKIFRNVLSQFHNEARKCLDKGSGKKLMKLVRSSNTEIGERQGIHLSLATIGKILGRSKATAHGYIERLHRDEIVRRKKNYAFVSGEIKNVRGLDEYRGRVFVDNGKVFMRLQNSYVFNA